MQKPRIRLSGIGLHFPGSPISIADLPLTPAEMKRLPRLGQDITHISTEDSTTLMVYAARDALQSSGVAATNIRLVISAPSLVTAYGLEIPAVALKAELGLRGAHCLNIAQGCVGVLRGIDLAAKLLAAEPDGGDIMVVTSCRASSHTRNMNHGAFFWGDAAAAVILTSQPGPGLEVSGYAEASTAKNWGAMRIRIGEAEVASASIDGGNQIDVHFDDAESQMDYIRGEQQHFASVIDELLAKRNLTEAEIEAIFLPSTGRNRVPILFSEHQTLLKKLATDLRFAHFGGVDPIFSIHQYLNRGDLLPDAWLMVASPAFTAQWGGLLLRVAL
jgi:3-oxoacyl-[acyl-carrier-protein] synthase III